MAFEIQRKREKEFEKTQIGKNAEDFVFRFAIASKLSAPVFGVFVLGDIGVGFITWLWRRRKLQMSHEAHAARLGRRDGGEKERINCIVWPATTRRRCLLAVLLNSQRRCKRMVLCQKHELAAAEILVHNLESYK